MTVDTLLMLLGAFIAMNPFLGFPPDWDRALLFIAGVFVIALGIIVRRRGNRPPARSRNEEMSSEIAHRHEELAQ